MRIFVEEITTKTIKIMETLNFIKEHLLNSYKKQFKNSDIEIVFGNVFVAFMHNDNHTLECCFEEGIISLDGEQHNGKGISTMFTIGFKTPKGYISSKKIPVSISNKHDITIEEIKELLAYDTDAVRNTFDPFYAENEAKRRNAIGWNFVALNHLQDDCR